METLQEFDETLCRKVRLVSALDREAISENRERSANRLNWLLQNLQESQLSEREIKRYRATMLAEAQKLESLVILEAVSNKDFFEVQKNFRSMIRAANVIIRWFPGSKLAADLERMRTDGIEYLSMLYDEIKNMEAGADMEKMGAKSKDPKLTGARDEFMKIFTNFAVLFRGSMAIADLFTDDLNSDMQGIMSSLGNDELAGLPLGTSLVKYDNQNDAMSRDGGIKKIFSNKGKGLYGKFVRLVASTLASKSPNFQKFVSTEDVIKMLMGKSPDQLQAYFGRFNDFVANDVDTNFLMKVSQNPRGIGALFKGLWNSLGGHVKGITS